MASENVLEFTDANWQKEVVESTLPVVVDFWAPWCGPCRALSPTITSLAAKYDGKVKVGKINIDESQETATRFGVVSIPRVLIFKGGEDPKQTFVGLRSEADLAKAIDGVLQEK